MSDEAQSVTTSVARFAGWGPPLTRVPGLRAIACRRSAAH